MEYETYEKIMALIRWLENHNDNLTDKQCRVIAEIKQLIMGD